MFTTPLGNDISTWQVGNNNKEERKISKQTYKQKDCYLSGVNTKAITPPPIHAV